MTTTSTQSTDEAKIKALEEFIAPIVTTMGPEGCNVAMNIHRGGQFVGSSATQDGVTLAKHQALSETPEERQVSQLLDESTTRQVDSVGDGTTSTLVLCLAMFKAFVMFKKIKSRRFAKILFTRMEASIRELWKDQVYDEWLDPGSNAEKATKEQKAQYQLHRDTIKGIAGVATHGDESLTSMLVEAALHVGPTGHIEVQRPGQGEERHMSKDALELGKGMSLKSRLAFRQLSNSKYTDRMSFIAEEGCLWLISNTPIQKGASIAKCIQAYNVYNQKHSLAPKPLIIAAPSFSADASNVASNNSVQKYGFAPDGRPNGVMICLLSLTDKYNDKEVIDVIEDLSLVVGAPVYGTKTDKRITRSATDVKNGKPVFGQSKGLVSVGYDGTTIRFTEEEEDHVQEVGQGLVERGEKVFKDGSSKLALNYIARGKRILGQTAKIVLRSGPHSVQNARFDLADDSVRTFTSAFRSGVARGQGVALINLGYNLIADLHDKYGYDEDLLLNNLHPAFRSVRQQVLLNMEVPYEGEVNQKVLDAIVEGNDAKDIVTFDDSGEGFEAISAKEHFIYDGAETAITALEISLQTSKQLGTTEWIMDVHQ